MSSNTAASAAAIDSWDANAGKKRKKEEEKNPRLLFAELTRPRRWHHRHRVSLTSLPSWLAAPVPLDEPNIPEFYSAALTGQESKLSPTSTLHKK